jgi:FkbM family methyltransferase
MTSLKRAIQQALMKMGIYERLRASFIYDAYWSFADRELVAQRQAELKFYQGLLKGFKKGDLIFDIGANDGFKAQVFLKLGAKVVAVEPDEHNQKVLMEKFLKYRLNPHRVTVVGKAVSDCVKVEKMWCDAPGSALNTLSTKWVGILQTNPDRFGSRLEYGQSKEVETTTVEKLMADFGAPFFLKIDVEGYEAKVLKGLQRPVPFLSFEVNLPEFKPEGRECIELLGALAEDGEFNYVVEYHRGLALDRWVSKREFLEVFEACPHKSVEIIWKTL